MAINDKLENVIDKLNTLIENGGGTPLPYHGGMPIEDHVEHISEQIDAIPAGGGGEMVIPTFTLSSNQPSTDNNVTCDMAQDEIVSAVMSGKCTLVKVIEYPQTRPDYYTFLYLSNITESEDGYFIVFSAFTNSIQTSSYGTVASTSMLCIPNVGYQYKHASMTVVNNL